MAATTTHNGTKTTRKGKANWTGPVVPMTNGEIIPIDGYGSRTVLLDPPTAKAWLESQERNRSVKERKIEQFAAAIRRGEWRFNAQTIGFDKAGKMIDGQHRCHAVIRANKTVTVLVAWGLDADAQDTMDVGTARSFKDALQMRGVKNSADVASVTRHLFVFEDSGGRLGIRGIAPTIPQLQDTLERWPAANDAPKVSRKVKSGGLRFPESVSGVLWVLFRTVDPDDADQFFALLRSGANMDEDNPIFALRRVVLKQLTKQYQIDVAQLGALTIKAWNKWRRGESALILSYKPGGANPEPFPKIDGFDYSSLVRPVD